MRAQDACPEQNLSVLRKYSKKSSRLTDLFDRNYAQSLLV